MGNIFKKPSAPAPDNSASVAAATAAKNAAETTARTAAETQAGAFRARRRRSSLLSSTQLLGGDGQQLGATQV